MVVALFEQLADQLADDLNHTNMEVILAGQIWLALFEKDVGNAVLAEERLERIHPVIMSQALAKDTRQLFLAFWHLRRGELAIYRDYSVAEHQLRKGLNLFYQVEHTAGIAQTTGLLGETEWRLGAYVEAISALEECLEKRRVQSNWREIARATDLLGSVHRSAGSGELSAASASECMASYRRLQDRLGTARAQANLARTIAIYEGELNSAITLLQGSIATFA